MITLASSLQSKLEYLVSKQRAMMAEYDRLSEGNRDCFVDHPNYDRTCVLMDAIRGMQDEIFWLESQIEDVTYNDYSGDNPQM